MKVKSAFTSRFNRILLVLGLVVGLVLPASVGQPFALNTPDQAAGPPAESSLGELPLGVQYAFSADMGRDDSSYHLRPDEGGEYSALNHNAGLVAQLSEAGMSLRFADQRWSLGLEAWGRGSDLQAVGTVQRILTEANRLEYTRKALSEWYRNGPLGLQNGWTLQERPDVTPSGGSDGDSDDPVTLSLVQDGTLHARLDGDRRGLALVDAGGAVRLRYGGLLAFDAEGRELPAWLDVAGEILLVCVDDRAAAYPITIDPWVQASKLTTSHAADHDQMGYAVAVSGDGSTIVVGAPWHDAGGLDRGVVYVYSRLGGWVTTPLYSAKLTASGSGDGDRLGSAVAISADGSTVVAGAPAPGAGGTNRGAVYVFTRPGGGWVDSTQSARLTANGGADGDGLGAAVGISEDGNTVVAGAPYYSAGGIQRGAAYLYSRPSGGWVDAQQDARFVASGSNDNDLVGWSVAVSGDGATVAAGAPEIHAGGTGRGAVYIYNKPESGWTDAAQNAKLTASDGENNDELGVTVALNDDGSVVAAGAPQNNAGGYQRGAAYVFLRPSSGWAYATHSAKLTAGDGGDNDFLGTAVALSADGATLIAGAPLQDITAGSSNRGAVYVYNRPAGGWADGTQTAKLSASNGEDEDYLGSAAAISADGATVVAGAPQHNTEGDNRGAAYAYARPGGGWATTTETARLTAYDGEDIDHLGFDVAISGDGTTLVAGAPYHDAGGVDRGAVYIYTRPAGGWAATAAFTARLIAGDGEDNDHLGFSVAASEDGATVVVGAQGYLAGFWRGAVYIFTRPTYGWVSSAAYTAKLTASDGVNSDELGYAVAVSGDGDTAVAGAPSQDLGGVYRGAVYIFTRPATGWVNATQTAKLTAGDGANNDFFGRSVAVSQDGSSVVAGAHQNAAGGFARGAVYVFTRPSGGWLNNTQTAKLTAGDSADGDVLGKAVAISSDGGTIFGGAPGQNVLGNDRGAVYIYIKPNAGWVDSTQIARLTANDGADSDIFGSSVTVSADGSTVAAGARNAAGGTQRGAVYVYERPVSGWANTGVFKAKLTASDGADGDDLGFAAEISADGGVVIAGADQHDTVPGGIYRGAAYAFALLIAPVFTSAAPPSPAYVGVAYNHIFSASGSPQPTFNLTQGDLPSGLALDAASGTLKGAPTTVGSYDFTVTASNGLLPDATQDVSIEVQSVPVAPTITSGAPSSPATVGVAYTFTFTANGNPAPTFSVTGGALPPGLTLNATSGALTGTPTADGSYTFTVTAANGVAPDASQEYTILVQAAAGGSYIYLPLILR